MDKPLISVILPVYNVEAYFPKCMESLFVQTYGNLEFVVVDDGSNEKCRQLFDEYSKKDPRVVVYHKENGGISDARNYGIAHAKGKYVTYVDPDDCVDEDYVETLYNLLVKYNCKMSICPHRVHYENGDVADLADGLEFDDDKVLSSKECIERMLYHEVIDTSVWGKLYERELFQGIEYPVGKLFEDLGVTYKLMLKCDQIAVNGKSKYTYNFHDSSIVNSQLNEHKLDMIEMADNLAKEVNEIYPELESATKRRQVYARLSTLNQMLYAKGPEFEQKRREIINYVNRNSKEVAKNPRTPKRDKLAFLLLKLGYPVYRFCWLQYRKKIMNN